jgi:hypothetical protein
MITEFEDFCTWVFVVVDDVWEQISLFFKRPGPRPECSNSELIAMALIGECRGRHMETELLEQNRIRLRIIVFFRRMERLPNCSGACPVITLPPQS